LFCIWCRNTSKVNLIKDKVPYLKEVFSLILLKVVKLEGITSLAKTTAIKLMLKLKLS
jgi:hypothetical protein